VTVRLEVADGVATVVLDRPERLNAISTTLARDLHAALRRAADDAAVRVIVLTGNGRAFCAGDDLKEFAEQARDRATTRAHIEAIQEITRDLMLGAVPVVCAARGYAVGGGFEWLLNADLVVAGDDLVCSFPELAIGQFPTGGVTWLLPRALGHQRAMELFLLGERQPATRLHALGLVNEVVPPDEVLPRALAIARTLASRPEHALRRLKQLVAADRAQLEAVLARETEATVEAFHRADAAHAAAAFAARPRG